MSHGRYTMQAPHICGEVITFDIEWWYHNGSYDEPPDGDEEWKDCPNRCPKCGVDLGHDDLFHATVKSLQEDRTDYDEDDGGRDYEPDDDSWDEPEEYWEPMEDEDY